MFCPAMIPEKTTAMKLFAFAISFFTLMCQADLKAAYLFVYFTGNDPDQEQIFMAVSRDGYSFHAMNGGHPIITSAISESGGLRDPHILRCEDHSGFYMVATDMKSSEGWDSNRGLVMMKSPDLVHWETSRINIQRRFAGNDSLKRVWAPQTIYDKKENKYMVYWSMKHGSGPDIIYYAYANEDFTDLINEPRQLFFPKDGKSCIDGDIVTHDGHYYLFYKTEDHGNGIKVAVTDSLTSGRWTEQPDYKQLTSDPVEGAGVFYNHKDKLFVLAYDVYTKGRYEFAVSTDLVHFSPCPFPVEMDFQPRHGAIIEITEQECDTLTHHQTQEP